jgi:hypothetical protein
MISQPQNSRVIPSAWARMSDEQRAECVAGARNRDLLTKAVREPESLTIEEIETLGPDFDLVVERIEAAQTETEVELQTRHSGVWRRRPAQEVTDDAAE